MLIDFFFELRKYKIQVSISEFLDLLDCLQNRLACIDINDFYYLSRLVLIKDEKYFDTFDKIFGFYFKNLDKIDLNLDKFNIPPDWLYKQADKFLTDEEKAKITSQGDLNKLLEIFNKRLKEQKQRHQGGNKWIGTAGTSPFGAFGFNPHGFRIGQGYSNHKSAIKVWEERLYRNLSEDNDLNLRNLQLSLRRLRKFTKNHAMQEFDLDNTIKATANNAGFLDIKTKFSKHNLINVLVFFDVGGSMDSFVKISKQLFLAAKSEFKFMKYFYFHNCIYENVWLDNNNKNQSIVSVQEIFRTYKKDYKVIIVGDACMSPYELIYTGGSIDHFNSIAGAIWLQKITDYFDNCVWLNPIDQDNWNYIESIQIIRKIFKNKMFPLTTAGINKAITKLN